MLSREGRVEQSAAMLRARALCTDRTADLTLGFRRMGLPTSAGDYLLEKLPQLQVLLTGLTRTEGRFLKGLFETALAPGFEEFPAYASGDQGRRPGTGLLTGRREQFERLIAAARGAQEQAPLASALERLLASLEPPAPLTLGPRRLSFGTHTHVMGVVNVTPDSFSDGGRFSSTEQAVAHGLALAAAGADILDVGGETTRPGSSPVSAEQELSRVLPVL